MSDLRERLIEAGAHGLDPQPWQRVGHEEAHRHDEVTAAVVNAAMPIIEAELQKRDQEIKGLIEQRDYLWPYKDKALEAQNALTEANKLREQTIEVLEGRRTELLRRAEAAEREWDDETVRYQFRCSARGRQLAFEQAAGLVKPLLDNLKALKKEGWGLWGGGYGFLGFGCLHCLGYFGLDIGQLKRGNH